MRAGHARAAADDPVDLALALKAIVKALVLPPAGPIAVALAGLVLRRRAPRAGRALLWTGAISLVLLCLPIVAWLLSRPFDAPPLDLAEAKRAQAIVILGGGTRRRAPEYGGDTMARLTAERVRYGARVARETGLPVLVSGGTMPDVQAAEAAIMRDVLEREYGVPVRWAEDRSHNTHENAQYSASLLRKEGVTTVVLVAHAMDMPRARGEFRAAGMETIAAPTGLAAAGPMRLMDFVPSAAALQASHDALYEILANAVRVVGGR
jgi:uncharacterized SAM-binding protein YcdF (DUF218 family)